MRTKTKKAFEMTERFTADSVTIEEPGSSVTYSRQEVEGWLRGMEVVRRYQDDDACRRAVAETIVLNRSKRREQREVGLRLLGVFLLGFYCLFLSAHAACASEIIRGYAPQDGQQLYAADLDNLIDESTIGVQFFNDQQTTPVLGAGYYFLVLNPANQTYYRISAQQMLYGNTNLFLNAPPQAVPAYGVLVFYDPTNNWIASTTVSNFLWNSASNINVAGLSFANSNNTSASMRFVLSKWPYPFSGLPPAGTNYPVHFLIFDTNGIPYRESLTNLEAGVSMDFGTYFSIPWEYEQEFAPWSLYGTNTFSPLTTLPPFTNAFGWNTNFPITAFVQTNISGTNMPTLLDNDTIPVNSGQQNTNTSATLLSIYQYMTNKNALPPYTIGRIQFAGVPDQIVITNMDPVNGIITNVAEAVNWSNAPVAVSWKGALTQIPTLPSVQSNQIFYAVQTNWPNLAFQIYTNYANALARTLPVTGLGVAPASGKEGTLYWCTNYTSVNADVIQTANATALRTAVYDVYFRMPAQFPYYYVTGIIRGANGTGIPSAVFINFDDPGSTNYVQIGTGGSGIGYQQFSLVQVLLQPE